MKTTMGWGGWAGWASIAGVCAALAVGCSDDASTSSPDANGGTGGATDTAGGAAGATDAIGGVAGATEAIGETAGAVGAKGCDCGDNPDFVHVPLECAQQHGLITTFEDDLKDFQDGTHQLGTPYYVLHGACDDGYRTLEFSEATENGGIYSYDSEGNLVYRSYGPYSSPDPVCIDPPDTNFGDFGIGAVNPAEGCTYCLVDSHWDESLGGAPAEYDTTPCTPADLD